ncbi:MAG: serine/threonine protein kinase [Candidatus Eremiobacteraeota bacterium]|nr:serine/threonine protein kinase [Candidatus Eremiobacteraeota bacterium]
MPDRILANRYRIVERIGKGGMGDIFLAVDHVLEREVAVKILTDTSDEVSRRFLIEARSMARLNHPNIVAVYDVGVDREVSYIILEHVSGSAMANLDLGGISLDDAVGLTIQLLQALRYAHDRGVLHRDIKPGNIMLTDDLTLKVMDFGLARRLSDATNSSQSGEIVGTVAYLPPERFLGKPGDRTADLYSVGVVLYELLCGRLPFRDDSADLVAIMSAHINESPAPPRRFNPAIPVGLNDAVMRLLHADPAQRYPDAASAIDRLEAERLVWQTASARLDRGGTKAPLEHSVPGGQERARRAFAQALTFVVAGMVDSRRHDLAAARRNYAAAVTTLARRPH